MVGVPGIVGGRELHIPGRPAMGEFPCCRFAEQDPAGGTELLCHHGILCRDVIGQQLRLCRGPDPGRLDDVLQAIGNAVQRAAGAVAHDLCLGRPRALPGKLGGQGDKAHQLVVNRERVMFPEVIREMIFSAGNPERAGKRDALSRQQRHCLQTFTCDFDRDLAL